MCLIERLLQPLRNLDLYRAAASVVITQSIDDGVTKIGWRRDGIDGDADAASHAIEQHFVAWCCAKTATTATNETFVNRQDADHTLTDTATTTDRATTTTTAAAG
jgi:hypothetical protein